MSGYVVAQINMTNKEDFKTYAEQVPETVKQLLLLYSKVAVLLLLGLNLLNNLNILMESLIRY